MAKKTTAKAPETREELQAALATKQADLLGYKKGLVAGELKNPSIIKQTRKEIARLNTAITQRNIGKEGES